MSCKSPENPHTNIFISYHCLSTEGRTRGAPALAPGSCFSQPFPWPSYLQCCSPCPWHRASSSISCSHPPQRLLLPNVQKPCQHKSLWVTLKPHLVSDEEPLWPRCNLCSTPPATPQFHYLSLFWHQIPLPAPWNLSTATSPVPEGSCTAWAEPHCLQQCPAANSIA